MLVNDPYYRLKKPFLHYVVLVAVSYLFPPAPPPEYIVLGALTAPQRPQ